MNARALIVYSTLFSIVWLVALGFLISYGVSPSPTRLIIFGILLLIAPVILLAGAGPAILRIRHSLHKQATRARNLETSLTEMKSALISQKSKDPAQQSPSKESAVQPTHTHPDILHGGSSQEHDGSSVKVLLENLRTKVAGHATGLTRLTREGASIYDTESILIRLAAFQGIPLRVVMNTAQVENFLRTAADRSDLFSALLVLREFPESSDALTLTQARATMNGVRRLGYLGETSMIMDRIARRTGKITDQEKATILRSEYLMYAGSQKLKVDLPPLRFPPKKDTVLHFVGKALPSIQTGYTLRTQYTVEAQHRKGINAVVAVQAGATKDSPKITEHYEHQGVEYYVLGGALRNTVPWDQWLTDNIRELASVVQEVRPSILHSHSDFLNAIIVQHVGDAYGIPVVNETRGFWEESWLSRKESTEGWDSLEPIQQLYGLPTAYTLRQEQEINYRNKASVVVTLAHVMSEHIDELGRKSDKDAGQIEIVPNAVDADSFPVLQKNLELVNTLGIPNDATIIGYISSVVEYEGIDILLRGFFEVVAARNILRRYAKPPMTTNNTAYESSPREVAAFSDRSSPASVGQNLSNGQEDLRLSLLRSVSQADRAIEDLATKLISIHPDLEGEGLRTRSEEILRATAGMDTKKPLHLLIVGDGPELAGLKALSKKLGAEESVTLTGRVPHEQVLEYYSTIDLFVVPRRPSTVTELVTPLKPFEAMSTGRPCLFSDVGALTEIAQNSEAAATFRAGDYHDLAIKIGQLLREPLTLSRMSTQGAKWVRKYRTWDHNADKYLEIYESLGLRLEK